MCRPALYKIPGVPPGVCPRGMLMIALDTAELAK